MPPVTVLGNRRGAVRSSHISGVDINAVQSVSPVRNGIISPTFILLVGEVLTYVQIFADFWCGLKVITIILMCDF